MMINEIEYKDDTIIMCKGCYYTDDMKTFVGVSNGCNTKQIEVEQGCTFIADKAFYNSDVERVSLPETIRGIGVQAFAGCKCLKNIYLPNTITTIGAYAFENSGLKHIYISKGVTTILQGVFKDCEELSSVYLPRKLQVIEDFAFASCHKLTSMDFPKHINTVGVQAFADSGLISRVGKYALFRCDEEDNWYHDDIKIKKDTWVNLAKITSNSAHEMTLTYHTNLWDMFNNKTFVDWYIGRNNNYVLCEVAAAISGKVYNGEFVTQAFKTVRTYNRSQVATMLNKPLSTQINYSKVEYFEVERGTEASFKVGNDTNKIVSVDDLFTNGTIQDIIKARLSTNSFLKVPVSLKKYMTGVSADKDIYIKAKW